MGNEVATRNDVGTSLDLTKGLNLEGLREDQKQAVLERLQNAKICLAKDIAERKIKTEISAVDMDQTISKANRLEAGKNDYKVSSSHETGSGHTEISVSRNDNTGMLVVIVIIGIVLIIALSKVL